MKNKNNEIWFDIPSFESKYMISNKLRVKSIISNNKILKDTIGRNGYIKYTFVKNGKNYYMLKHRIVATVFIENKLNYPCVNHIDSNRSNCEINNLEWCTYSQNTRHAIKSNRLSWVGENNGKSKLKKNEVLEIFKSNLKTNLLSEKYKISEQAIRDIKQGRRWCETTGKRHKSITRIIENI